MPRKARKISSTGYMHVITRGIGKQILFESTSDYRKYLLLLKKYCEETNVKISAFCLMENHVHLLTLSDSKSLILMMKKIGISYAEYYNLRYEHTGHLFQDRYQSEPIENDEYLLTVFRYILLNPQKTGICNASDYTWSSYSLYDSSLEFMDLKLIHDLLGNNKCYEKFINEENNDECLEFSNLKKTDKWAIQVIKDQLGFENGTEIQKLDKTERDKAVKLLKKLGLGERQLERLTGIGRNIIRRI